MALPNPLHPQASGLVHLWSETTGTKDLVTEADYTVIGAPPEVFSTPLGPARRGNGASRLTWGNRPDISAPGATEDTLLAVVYIHDTVGLAGGFVGRTENNVRRSLTGSSSNQQFSAVAASGNAVYNPAGSVGGGLSSYAGKVVALLSVKTATNLRLCVRVLESGASSVKTSVVNATAYPAGADSFSVLSRGGSSQYMTSSGSILASAAWSRSLSEAEEDNLLEDPFSLLRPADVEAPIWSGSAAVTSATSSTLNITLPVPSDNVGLDYIQYRVDGGAWINNALSQSISLTSLNELTSYFVEAVAFDNAGNASVTASITASTYRVGASAGSIVAATGPQDGNPAGTLHALASTLPVDAWVSYRTVSGPTPSGGTLVAQPNGAFSYTGPAPAVWTIQPEINGVDHTDTVVVTLYDQSSTPSSSTLSRWDGSQMVTGGTSRRWDGTAWVAGGTLRRHNGTTWS